jgi:uncharacterized membrane protein YiaA
MLDFLGAMLITTGGIMLAIIPRIDLSLGGIAIALSGIVLMDFNRNGNLGFNNLVQKYIASPSSFMGCCGIACCFFLGGGEMLDIISRGQQNNPYEPGYIKVVANLFPYAFASVLSFSSVRNKLKGINSYMITFLQVSLFATGHMMIAVYGFRAGNSAYQIGTILFFGALFGMIGIVLANLKKKS